MVVCLPTFSLCTCATYPFALLAHFIIRILRCGARTFSSFLFQAAGELSLWFVARDINIARRGGRTLPSGRRSAPPGVAASA